MIGFTEQLSQGVCIPVASISPSNVAVNNTTPTTILGVDMSKFKRAMAHVIGGVLSGTNTLVQFQASSNAANSYTNIANGPSAVINSNSYDVTLEIRSDQMPAGTRYLGLSLLSTGNANTGHFLAAAVYGAQAHYSPSSQFDAANSNTFSLNRQVATI